MSAPEAVVDFAPKLRDPIEGLTDTFAHKTMEIQTTGERLDMMFREYEDARKKLHEKGIHVEVDFVPHISAGLSAWKGEQEKQANQQRVRNA